jgi:signal transduction histidine kinase
VASERQRENADSSQLGAGEGARQQDRTERSSFVDETLPMLVKRAVLGQVTLILTLVWAYAAWSIHTDRKETLASAHHELRALVAGMYVHLQAVLNDSLGAVRAAVESIDANGGIQHVPGELAAESLARELSSGDYVRALFIAAPGRFLSAARNGQSQVLVAAPEWLAPRTGRNVFIGSPIADPNDTAKRAIPIAVRATDAAGTALWVGALLGVEALDHLYESMAIRDGALSLVSARGDLLLRVPALAHADKPINLSNAPLFQQVARLSHDGVVEGPSAVAEGTWVFAVQRLRGYGLAVTAGRERQAILQPWRDRAIDLVLVLGGISLLFIALTVLLRNFVYRLEQANTTLAQLNTDLESRVTARTIELQQANERLAMTNQELEAFTASVSHDLRSPLGAIAGQAGLLRDELQASMTEQVRQRIDRIQSSVSRSAEIIDGMLSLARISRQELLNERVDLSELAGAIVEELRQQYPRHGVECRIEPGLAVNADPRLMKSLLGNLLDNAWKYTAKIPGAAVELGCTQGAEAPVFLVRDNGAGFDMAGAEQLFEPFRRLHSSSEFPGIGIGLATVARIVQRYAGKITAQSEPGRGTVFRFTLPAAALPTTYPGAG